MNLTIVIPVLDEEESVEGTARDCLAAREAIVRETPVRHVNVVVVSDGSTDRTVEIARGIPEVTTVVFPENRGYGAAIQAGWEEKPADLLGFLDGDGTCDARFFVDLVQALEETGADVALGSRMSRGSEMPTIRRVGNWLFAVLLGLLARDRVTDSASGMRVVRRSALKDLLPLPAGLHFTPAMSARAMIGGVPIVERPMPYRERAGRSKLRVLRDGFRFLGVILAAAAFIRPSRLTLPLIAALAVICALYITGPTLRYLEDGRVDDWMVYRLLFVSFLATLGVTVFCTTIIAEHVIAIGLLKYDRATRQAPWWWTRRATRAYLVLASLLLVPAFVLIWPGLVSYLETGLIPFDRLHWSRPLLASFLGLTFLQFLAAHLLTGLVDAVNRRQFFLLRRDDP